MRGPARFEISLKNTKIQMLAKPHSRKVSRPNHEAPEGIPRSQYKESLLSAHIYERVMPLAHTLTHMVTFLTKFQRRCSLFLGSGKATIVQEPSLGVRRVSCHNWTCIIKLCGLVKKWKTLTGLVLLPFSFSLYPCRCTRPFTSY